MVLQMWCAVEDLPLWTKHFTPPQSYQQRRGIELFPQLEPPVAYPPLPIAAPTPLVAAPASLVAAPTPCVATPLPPAPPAGPCQHQGGWHSVRGEADCESCAWTMPDFILECNGCDRQVCVRCSCYYFLLVDIWDKQLGVASLSQGGECAFTCKYGNGLCK